MKNTKIGKRSIGDKYPVFMIAEVGGNHNGDSEMAKKIAVSAIHAGADAVKFQTYKTDSVVSKSSQYYNEFKKEELPFKAFKDFARLCCSNDVEFISTPLDIESVDELEKIGVSAFKIASGDITNFPLLKRIAKTKRPIILSTGASDLNEVENSLNVIRAAGGKDVVIMHCVATYPASPEDMNLRVIEIMRKRFNLPIGLSDHTPGIEVSPAAIALGYCVIERHFTIDRKLPGGDNSLMPFEFETLVKSAKIIKKALGRPAKKASVSEKKVAPLLRRSIVSARLIKKGEILSEDMLSVKRPASGISPESFDEIIGLKVKFDIAKDQQIKWGHLSVKK